MNPDSIMPNSRPLMRLTCDTHGDYEYEAGIAYAHIFKVQSEKFINPQTAKFPRSLLADPGIF